MWVKDGNADIDHIRTQDEVFPIIGTPTKLNGTWWQFFKTVPSIHNTYCPDIKIEVVTQTAAHPTYKWNARNRWLMIFLKKF